MSKKVPDKKADRKEDNSLEDRGETVGLMEPMIVPESSRHRTRLTDLALELAARSAGFRRSLPAGIATSLCHLVRAMNCYYSNLIEGHNTHPVDIERAMRDDYSSDPVKRDLQREARAHVTVQAWIDETRPGASAATLGGVMDIHRKFCELMPDDLLWVENPDTHERRRVIPGAFRTDDVAVARHIAVSPGAIPRFMARFEEAYTRLGRTNTIIASAYAHHRLLWIHPFADGNGRVARLMSYAMQHDALETGGLWSIARGLARNEQTYKQHLAACDQPRRNDLDGRGTLSEEALCAFAEFFLETCLDQVSFMEGLVDPDRLRERIVVWALEEVEGKRLPPRTADLLEILLYRGELPRAEVPHVLGTGERNARRITSMLLDREILTASGSKAPLKLAFPASLAGRWMPGLFPEA